MGHRILRVELRRSVALWAALLIAAVGVFVLFASNPPYRSWMELVIVQRDVMQLTWPLALAAGAWQGIRERRSRVEELFATTPRPRWRRVLPVATAMAIGAVAAYLLMFAGAAGHLKHIDAYFPTGAVPLIALGALTMVTAVWLGLAIGTLLPSPLTAPMLVVIGFVALAVLPSMLSNPDHRPGAFLLLPYMQGPRESPYLASILTPRANLSQLLWLAAVAATGLALFAAARPGTRVAALLPALLGLAIAVPVMPRQLNAAWGEDRRATDLICTRDEPRICVSRINTPALPALREPGRQALAVLAAKLPPPAPTRIVVNPREDLLEGPQPADTLIATPFIIEYGEVETAPEDLLMELLLGAGTRPCATLYGTDENPNLGYLAARIAAAAWLLDRDLPPPVDKGEQPDLALAHEALDALRYLPADEQRARVAALRDAERTCAAGDRLELLTGTGGPR
jgi:hypothetical protein